MCCRYSFTTETYDDVRGLIAPDTPIPGGWRAGDIRPADSAMILSGANGKLSAGMMKWGFPSAIDGKLIINARAETVPVKKTFAGCFKNTRCIVPAATFYEWNSRKEKATFCLPGSGTIYMAGLYSFTGGTMRYTIITTAANESMSPVHDRMPLIFGKDEAEEWILDASAAAALISAASPMLDRQMEYEQMSLY